MDRNIVAYAPLIYQNLLELRNGTSSYYQITSNNKILPYVIREVCRKLGVSTLSREVSEIQLQGAVVEACTLLSEGISRNQQVKPEKESHSTLHTVDEKLIRAILLIRETPVGQCDINAVSQQYNIPSHYLLQVLQGLQHELQCQRIDYRIPIDSVLSALKYIVNRESSMKAAPEPSFTAEKHFSAAPPVPIMRNAMPLPPKPVFPIDTSASVMSPSISSPPSIAQEVQTLRNLNAILLKKSNESQSASAPPSLCVENVGSRNGLRERNFSVDEELPSPGRGVRNPYGVSMEQMRGSSFSGKPNPSHQWTSSPSNFVTHSPGTSYVPNYHLYDDSQYSLNPAHEHHPPGRRPSGHSSLLFPNMSAHSEGLSISIPEAVPAAPLLENPAADDFNWLFQSISHDPYSPGKLDQIRPGHDETSEEETFDSPHNTYAVDSTLRPQQSFAPPGFTGDVVLGFKHLCNITDINLENRDDYESSELSALISNSMQRQNTYH